MKCPFCKEIDNKVIDSRLGKDSDSIRRRRECVVCGMRFTTYEHIEQLPVVIIKKDGRREIFSKDKLRLGIKKACEKRNVSINVIDQMIDDLESDLKETDENEIPSSVIGETVMAKLHDIDDVAYVRFASVYREFKDVDDFALELKNLSSKKMNDKHFMQIALELAEKGQGWTSPNPMVGAIIVKNGEIVGKGYHRAAGLAHAEVNAIDDAKGLAKDSTLYVTLEPCNHTGRTPPCTESIIGAGIKRVVIAMSDCNPNVKGEGVQYLKQHGIDVVSGVCEDEAKKLNEVFIKHITTKLPFVIVKCATTMDGQIATKSGDSRWVSGKKSRIFVHKIRHYCDAIMVGINTVKKDNPSLTCRIDGAKAKDPARIILDSNLSIFQNAKILHLDSDAKTFIACSNSVSEDKKIEVSKQGATLIVCPDINGLIDLNFLMKHLFSIGITSILIEGGSHVIASAFKAEIVDKVIFFYAPKILGGNDGIPICTGTGPDLMNDCIPVKNINIQKFGDDVMIEGYI